MIIPIRKIKKLRKKKRYTPRKKEEIPISKIEQQFGLFLSKFGIELESQFQIGYRFFDFKVKGKNILIEFDGNFWHRNPETEGYYPANKIQKKIMKIDKLKNILAKANGFRLLRIWESDFKNKKHETIDKILKFINE